MPTVLPPRPAIRRRRRFRFRRPAPYWVAAATLALLTGLTVSRLLTAAAGPAGADEVAAVIVMTRPVAAGEPVGAGDTEVRQVSADLVPGGAREAPVAGELAVVDLHAGEILLDARLAPAGLSATAALLPPGTRGVAIPVGTGAPALQQGDRVDVLATMEPGLTDDGGGAPTFPVARAAVVVATGADGDAVTVAVAAAEAPRVAFALSAGTVTLSLVGA